MDGKLRVSGDRVEDEGDATVRRVSKDGKVISEVVEFSQVWTLDVRTWAWMQETADGAQEEL